MNLHPCPVRCLVLAAVLALTPPATAQAGGPTAAWAGHVRDAFIATHDGYSVDEVLLQDALDTAFLDNCRRRLTDAGLDPLPTDTQINLALLRLRKSGKLSGLTTRRPPPANPDAPDPPRYRHAAEIAARAIEDRHGANVDALLADPALRAQFDALALAVVPDLEGLTPYLLRKAALQLRKSRRLRPELTARIADWGRAITTFHADALAHDPQQVGTGPGIYIFRDTTGYLYIGEAKNLRARLTQHLSGSGRAALAAYFHDQGVEQITIEIHTFDPQSNARLTAHRRAYESELIASRQPRFNIRP